MQDKDTIRTSFTSETETRPVFIWNYRMDTG